MRARFPLWVWLGLGLILSACGGGSSSRGSSQLEVSPSQANLLPGEQLQFTAVMRTASGAVMENTAFSWQSSDPSIVTVDANGLARGVKLGVASIIASAGNQTQSATVGVVSPSPGGTLFDFSGEVFYEDRPFDEAGFTGEPKSNPVRNAVINVIAIDGFTTLDSGSTDNAGKFSFPGLTNNVRRGGIYLQVSAKTAAGNPTQVEIRNNLSDKATLALISSALDDSAGASFTTFQVTATSSGIGGAFNILDTFSSASELIQQSGSLCPSATGPAPCIPPLLIAYWEPGSSEGTFYDDWLDAIFICGGGICVPGSSPGDTDEYDDAVIAHEYGHFAMRHFSRDDSPGGEHRINDNAQDIRLSYSEGWGNFFSSAVRNSPLYVDTVGASSFSFNLESYTSPNFPALSPKTVYTTSEVAVAGVLWDIFDPAATIPDPTEQHDQLALGFNPTWRTILQIQGTTPSSLPATMESFQILFNTTFPDSSSALQTILQERKMELAPDATEATEPKLGVGQTQRHTLYKNGNDPAEDIDLIPFDVVAGQSYTIETLNLTNGADTLLTIKNEAGGTLFESDNRNNVNYKSCTVNFLGKNTCPPNDQTTLSSSITFFWSGSSTTLTAQVQRSPNAPPSAGRLGAYDIRLK